MVSFRWEMSLSTWYLRAGKNLPEGNRPQCFPRQEYHREDPFQTTLPSREPGEDAFWDWLNFFQGNFQPFSTDSLAAPPSLPPLHPPAPAPSLALGWKIQCLPSLFSLQEGLTLKGQKDQTEFLWQTRAIDAFGNFSDTFHLKSPKKNPETLFHYLYSY